jgi:hypothetical protein
MNASTSSPSEQAAGMNRLWMLCAPALHPGDMQGRRSLFWSEEQQEWVECLDEATRYTDAEKAALDLSRFESAGPLEWWTELPCPASRA